MSPSDSPRPVERVEQPGVEKPVAVESQTENIDTKQTYADVVKTPFALKPPSMKPQSAVSFDEVKT